MKIIKNGNDAKLRRAQTAERSEYKLQMGRYNETFFVCKCPYCGNEVQNWGGSEKRCLNT